MRGLLVGALALLAAGCGSSASTGVASKLVDPSKPPLISSLEQDSGSDALLLTTNRGLFRIEDGHATRVHSVVETPDGRSPVGKFLVVARSDDGALLGSGHPDTGRRVAGFLGLLRSEDEGKTWSVVSRYGIADLHAIRPLGGALYAYDAVLPAVIVSADGGKTWDERTAPVGRVVDFVVDPANPDQLLASTDKVLYRSTDGGHTWTSAAAVASSSLEWPTPEAAYRVDEDGTAYVSHNEAASWEAVGGIDGEPRALKAVGPEELYAALADASIVHSTDGGETWEEIFTP